MVDYGLKAVSLYETFNPVKNLWRNVLIVAIEDAIKMTNLIAKYPEFYGYKRYHSIDYVTLPNADFAKVCEYADLERIKDGKEDMSEMFRKWLHKSKEGSPVAGKRRNHSSSMSYV